MPNRPLSWERLESLAEWRYIARCIQEDTVESGEEMMVCLRDGRDKDALYMLGRRDALRGLIEDLEASLKNAEEG